MRTHLALPIALFSLGMVVSSVAAAGETDPVPAVSNVPPKVNLGFDLGVYSRDEAGGTRGSFATLQPRATFHLQANFGVDVGYGFTPAPAFIPGPAVDATYHRLFVRAFGRLPVQSGGVLLALGPALHLGTYSIRDATRVIESGTTLLGGVSGGLFYEHVLGTVLLRTGLEGLWTPNRLDVAVTLGATWGLGGTP